MGKGGGRVDNFCRFHAPLTGLNVSPVEAMIRKSLLPFSYGLVSDSNENFLLMLVQKHCCSIIKSIILVVPVKFYFIQSTDP